MTDSHPAVPEWLAFDGHRLVARGAPTHVALRLRQVEAERPGGGPPLLVFDADSGRAVDVDLRGSEAEVLARLGGTARPEDGPPRGPGRPRLGVVAREVTLLPRHWEWLATQPGGASAALRRLVESARRHGAGSDAVRDAREAAYRFMSALAGDLPGFEDASRALFGGDHDAFAARIARWPTDVRGHLSHLAARAFAPDARPVSARNGSDSSPV